MLSISLEASQGGGLPTCGELAGQSTACGHNLNATESSFRDVRRLLLWDIDGTLIDGAGISRMAFDKALSSLLGRSITEYIPSLSGKTDPQCVRETLTAVGLDAAEIDSLMRRAVQGLGRETAALRGHIAQSGSVQPGVVEVLQALQDRAVLNTVLTGNIAVNAVLKLDVMRLIDYFDMEVGAYGSDHEDRNELPEIAIERANSMRKQWFGYDDDVWIIGDAPGDAEAAKQNDLHCLLVATGKFSYEELSSLGADLVVHNLMDTEMIVDLLSGD